MEAIFLLLGSGDSAVFRVKEELVLLAVVGIPVELELVELWKVNVTTGEADPNVKILFR
jgi:hypothetical protein